MKRPAAAASPAPPAKRGRAAAAGPKEARSPGPPRGLQRPAAAPAASAAAASGSGLAQAQASPAALSLGRALAEDAAKARQLQETEVRLANAQGQLVVLTEQTRSLKEELDDTRARASRAEIRAAAAEGKLELFHTWQAGLPSIIKNIVRSLRPIRSYGFHGHHGHQQDFTMWHYADVKREIVDGDAAPSGPASDGLTGRAAAGFGQEPHAPPAPGGGSAAPPSGPGGDGAGGSQVAAAAEDAGVLDENRSQGCASAGSQDGTPGTAGAVTPPPPAPAPAGMPGIVARAMGAARRTLQP